MSQFAQQHLEVLGLLRKGYIGMPSFFKARLKGKVYVFCAMECRTPDGAVRLFTNQRDVDNYYVLPWVAVTYFHAYDCLLRASSSRAMDKYNTALEEVVNLLHNPKEQCLLVSEALLDPELAKRANVPFTVFRQAAYTWLGRTHVE